MQEGIAADFLLSFFSFACTSMHALAATESFLVGRSSRSSSSWHSAQMVGSVARLGFFACNLEVAIKPCNSALSKIGLLNVSEKNYTCRKDSFVC